MYSLFRRSIVCLALGAACAASPGAEEPAHDPYTWRNVAIGGGGFVTGIVPHPTQKGLIYARTDVGGAYRWDGDARRWTPLTDWIAEADSNLMGIESVAVDPRDPHRVYLAAGTYSRFPAAMLRSTDQGRTFQRTNVPIAMGGNESGRFAGERLAVDPNHGAILLFGSRRDGLWRSDDEAVSWHKVTGFPTYVEPTPPGANPNWNHAVGIVALVFDPASGTDGKPTPVVYAAVSTSETSLYRSGDNGATWTPMAGQPKGSRPNHLVLSPDRRLYVSYGNEPGPAQMSGGAVWAFDLSREVWTDISPLKGAAAEQPFGYGAVAVDPQQPATVMATTFTHWKPHDQIFRSRDHGATWTALWDDEAARWDYANAPYTATRSPHWLGTLVIDPFDSGRVLFTTGYGNWASVDVREADAGRPVAWQFLDDGLEETVPLALVSPPVGPHLISGVGDVDGFRHEDLDASPAGGSFAGPRFSSTRDIAFAAHRPNVLVRIGNAGRGVAVHIAGSEDGGRTWQAFIADPPNGGNGLGRVAIDADGASVLWALSNGTAFVTTDRGATWTPSEGITAPVSLAADPAKAERYYACDPVAGRVLTSTDGGRHFTASAFSLAGGPNAWRGEVLAVTPGRANDLWVGSRVAGLYHSTDAGESFRRLEPVEVADALGFGRAAPGVTIPAMYLRGRIAGQTGFFRSDDGGASWVRINDEQHQFGGANRPMIIGDPRVYGRVYLTTGGRGIIRGDPR